LMAVNINHIYIYIYIYEMYFDIILGVFGILLELIANELVYYTEMSMN